MTVQFSGERPILATRHTDEPGVIAGITAILYAYRINIGNMQVNRSADSHTACMYMELDGALPGRAEGRAGAGVRRAESAAAGSGGYELSGKGEAEGYVILEAEKLTAYLEQKKLRLVRLRPYAGDGGGTGSRQELRERMAQTLTVMERSVQKARREPVRSVSGLTGGNACLYESYRQTGKSILGEMASPGGGDGAVLQRAERVHAVHRRLSHGRLLRHRAGRDPFLRGNGGAGPGADDRRPVYRVRGGDPDRKQGHAAGAEGGCQAECGSAAAMGAARGGGNAWRDAGRGLSCGRHGAEKMCWACPATLWRVWWRIPCIKRNASGAVNALLSADLALAGVKSYIPFDEVVDAMYAIGRSMPSEIRETARGGLAMTPSGQRMRRQTERRKKIRGEKAGRSWQEGRWENGTDQSGCRLEEGDPAFCRRGYSERICRPAALPADPGCVRPDAPCDGNHWLILEEGRIRALLLTEPVSFVCGGDVLRESAWER